MEYSAFPSPDYAVYAYGNEVYKFVRYNSKSGSNTEYHKRKSDSFEKFDSSFRRACSNILGILLSNDFEFFFTGTLSPEKGDRFNLCEFREKITQFMRDKRKKYNSAISYILIPEPHKDGAIHFHGCVSVPYECLSRFDASAPLDLQRGDFYNWADYQKSFGFCSLSPIRDRMATAFYMLKYCTKDIGWRIHDIGGHLYYCSHNLNRPKLVDIVYGQETGIDCLLTSHNKFCSTGIQSLPFVGLGDIEDEKQVNEEFHYFCDCFERDMHEYLADFRYS